MFHQWILLLVWGGSGRQLRLCGGASRAVMRTSETEHFQKNSKVLKFFHFPNSRKQVFDPFYLLTFILANWAMKIIAKLFTLSISYLSTPTRARNIMKIENERAKILPFFRPLFSIIIHYSWAYVEFSQIKVKWTHTNSHFFNFSAFAIK